MNRIMKSRYQRSQVDCDRHSRSERDPQERATTSVHQQGNRHRSDSELHQKSFPEQSVAPTDPRTVRPLNVSTRQDQHDPKIRKPQLSSSLVSTGEPRRHTIDSTRSSRVEHERSVHKPDKQTQIESGDYRERESSMDLLHQWQPTQLKLSSSATSSHSAHVTPDYSPSVPGHSYAHSPLSPSHSSILGKGRKRVAHKSDKEIKSQRQEHKLSAPVSHPSDPAPPSKRPRMRSTSGSSSKGGIRTDLLKKMTKK